MATKYRIGVDVGGTNTDAVILRCSSESTTDAIVAWNKSPTSPDVTDGIASALKAVLQQSQIEKDDIVYISIGTTHFLNAVIEADPRRLLKVAVLRLSGPYTARCPPFSDFPPRLRAIIEGHVAIVDGGLEIDGKEIVPINDEELKEQCEIIRSKGIKNIVLVGVFSPLASAGTQEEHAKKIIEETLDDKSVSVVCSKDVGHIGLLERENASILNASILSFARRTVAAYYEVLKRFNLSCPLYLTQLDGTLLPASIAATIPIRTFSNGPTNSMRGAAFLAGFDKKNENGTRKSTIVIDVGGTTTDVGVLLPSGFPRKAAAFTQVGGVRTSFSMPDIHNIGLGGGSRVRFSPTGSVSIGPDSVGHAILSSALVFGGSTLTATDLAIAAGLPSASVTSVSIGDSARLEGAFTEYQTTAGVARLTALLESAIDRMKTEPGPVPILLVGGGAIIVPSELAGVSEIVRPPFFDVANAVGAAIARVSGVVDRVEIPGGKNGTIDEIVERCKDEAVSRAMAAGAEEASVEVAEVTVIQLPYVANHASRVIVRAVGDLDLVSVQQMKNENDIVESRADDTADESQELLSSNVQFSEPEAVDPSTYQWLAEGCAVLGCGGGGATYAAFLMARQALRSGRTIRVVSIDSLLECKDAHPDSWVMPCGFMGSPSVSSERIPSGQEIPTACIQSMRFLGIKKDQVAAVISDEIGGKNGLEPMLLAAREEFDLPVVDGDLMGRAYPRLEQILPCIFKENGLYPVSAADGVGNCMIVPTARNSPIVEDVLRAACAVLGSSIALSISPLQVHELRQNTIAGTTSQAWRIGKAIALCRKMSNLSSIPEAITALQDGKCLFIGKIVDVKREVSGGFTHGQITVVPLLQDELEGHPASDFDADAKLVIPFQNENIIAELVLCSVPDLIAVLDAQNGSSLGTQDYRYGLRVIVIGLACDPRWTSTKGLEIGGPRAFGLNIEYMPIGKYAEPRSVIEEYRQV
ncbi:DUF917-domain-containing protein [Phellopilus nigrolimitatus]|nr:DUF917-domain-containing protein [Phellopilus nigrolimitatus]